MQNLTNGLTSIIHMIGQVYLRFTNPKRKLVKLKGKLRVNREAQKKLINQSSTPRNRRRLSKFIIAATELRRRIESIRE